MVARPYGFPEHSALVTRAPYRATDPDNYLVLTSLGPAWTLDPAGATPFRSMKEAMRAALRLPGEIRAFGLPLESELTLRRTFH
jgi:hypothetical protein